MKSRPWRRGPSWPSTEAGASARRRTRSSGHRARERGARRPRAAARGASPPAGPSRSARWDRHGADAPARAGRPPRSAWRPGGGGSPSSRCPPGSRADGTPGRAGSARRQPRAWPRRRPAPPGTARGGRSTPPGPDRPARGRPSRRRRGRRRAGGARTAPGGRRDRAGSRSDSGRVGASRCSCTGRRPNASAGSYHARGMVRLGQASARSRRPGRVRGAGRSAAGKLQDLLRAMKRARKGADPRGRGHPQGRASSRRAIFPQTHRCQHHPADDETGTSTKCTGKKIAGKARSQEAQSARAARPAVRLDCGAARWRPPSRRGRRISRALLGPRRYCPQVETWSRSRGSVPPSTPPDHTQPRSPR